MKWRMRCKITGRAVALFLGIELCGSVAVAGEVDLKVDLKEKGSWRYELVRNSKGPQEVFTIRLKTDVPTAPPEFDAFFTCAPHGAHNLWQPMDEGMERHRLYAIEWGSVRYSSELARNEPLACAFGEDEFNSLTIACSEAMRHVKYAITSHSTDALLEGHFRFFTKPEHPISSYEVKILVDRRRIFWADAVREASAWIGEAAGLRPCRVPEAAFDPLYSSWYAFWQDVHDDDIVREVKSAAALGMKSAILDDGWQKESSKSYYSATGDWVPAKSRFPDMRAHVDKVHAAGIKNYMLWLSVPFVGNEAKAYKRFRGKYLWGEGGDVAGLDPRFPEVREHLVKTYERCVRDWDFDGLKLDFIDAISADDDPAAKEGWRGRDCKTIPEGVDRLMTAVHDRLSAIKPNILIEFRQRYTGPAIRRYGNMLRATDCPYDLVGNRKRIADLRLTSGGTAVHSDMLVWNSSDTPEEAGRVILNAIFGVVQYSMKLAAVSDSHRAVIRRWIDFSAAHRETLLKGSFRPRHPELMYPVIEAESAAERIVAVYSDGIFVTVASDRPTFILNAAAKAEVVVDLAAPTKVRAYDVFGAFTGETRLEKGLRRVSCPVSGVLQFASVEQGRERVGIPYSSCHSPVAVRIRSGHHSCREAQISYNYQQQTHKGKGRDALQ